MKALGMDMVMERAMQAGVNAGAEQGAKTVLASMVGFIKKMYGESCIDTETAFRRYLDNSMLRYNSVKILADLSEPRRLEGPDGIYVDVYVDYNGKRVSARCITDLLQFCDNNNVIIVGSGGVGKSMLMRHLFVSSYQNDIGIPILIELRKLESINNNNELFELMHNCMESFDVKLSQEQLGYSLRSGKYVILFDGLDEVRGDFRDRAAKLIQSMSSKYPKNAYIVSSRSEGMSFNELQTFSVMGVCPFTKEQAVEMILKIGRNNEKAKELAKLMDLELFKQHKDFASNPLLLTMMYITFIDNNKIPEHLVDFYENAYDALYKRHDANKEGLFKREYKCKNLGEREFKNLFSYFCFQSYFEQRYEFDQNLIITYIKRGIEKLNLSSKLKEPESFFF